MLYCVLSLQTEFKKEELRVRISNNALLTVSGERLKANDSKKIKFNREFKLSKDIYPDQIRAKFGSSVLSITMPKKASAGVGKPEAGVSNSEGKRTADSDNDKPKNFISSRFSRLKLSKQTAAAMAVAAVILALGAYYLTKN